MKCYIVKGVEVKGGGTILFIDGITNFLVKLILVLLGNIGADEFYSVNDLVIKWRVVAMWWVLIVAGIGAHDLIIAVEDGGNGSRNWQLWWHNDFLTGKETKLLIMVVSDVVLLRGLFQVNLSNLKLKMHAKQWD